MTASTPNEELKVLIEAEVSTIQLGYDIMLNLYGGSNRAKKYVELRINVPFQLTLKGETKTIDPDNSETWNPILELAHTKVADIDFADGKLSLSFDNGYGITIKPVPKYEAWTLTGDDLGFYVAVGT